MGGLENKPEEVKVNGYEIKVDKETTQDEIDFYESTEIKDPERDKKLQEDLSDQIKKGLSMLKVQSENILNSYKTGEVPTAEQVQALQILLRMSNNAEEQTDTVDDGNDKQKKQNKKVIAINGRSEDLIKAFGGTAESYMPQRSIIEGKFGSTATALLDNIILGTQKTDDYIEKSYHEAVKNGEFSEAANGLFNIDKADAAVFLEEEFKNVDESPNKFYQKFKNNRTERGKNVIASIQSLLEMNEQDGKRDSITPDIVRKWQSEHQDLFNYQGKKWDKEQIVDGKLGIMTISALIAFGKKVRKEYTASDKMDISGSADRRDVKEFDIDHDFDRMETNNKSGLMYANNLDNYGEWGDNGFKFKNGGIDGNGRNFVELNGNRFIEGTKNGKDVDSYTTKREIIRTYIDEDGNEHPVYRDNLSMGKFEDDILAQGQELVLKNGKQIKSTLFDRYTDRDDGHGKSRIGVVRIGDDVDKNGDFRGKWRIDLFGEDDTKRLDKEQLQKLDHGDITHVLDQAIAAFKETHHKPSEVGRYNLNRIIDRVLSEVGRNGDSRIILHRVADGKDSFLGDGPKARVENFFNLNDGLRSNLDHKIDKDDMTAAEKNVFKGMEKGAEEFEDTTENELYNKFKEDKLYKNKRTPDNFRRWLVGNRIITRLEGLQKAYSVLKPKEKKDEQDTRAVEDTEGAQNLVDKQD